MLLFAGIAQLVERNLAKVEVGSSRLLSRSRFRENEVDWVTSFSRLFMNMPGGVAEWLCSGLQSRGRRFDSDPRLHQLISARVVKLVDTRDLKSLGA